MLALKANPGFQFQCSYSMKSLYRTNLLSFFYLQLHPHAQAPKGVLEGLPQGFLHQDLVEGTDHATTQKHHHIGQQLQGRRDEISITQILCQQLYFYMLFIHLISSGSYIFR